MYGGALDIPQGNFSSPRPAGPAGDASAPCAAPGSAPSAPSGSGGSGTRRGTIKQEGSGESPGKFGVQKRNGIFNMVNSLLTLYFRKKYQIRTCFVHFG